MDKFAQVINSYLSRRLLMLGVALCGLMLLMSVGPTIVSASTRTMPIFASAFALAGCCYFLGAHVKQVLATPEATLIPRLRGFHLATAAAIFIAPIGLGCFLGGTSSLSTSGTIAVILFTSLSAFHMTTWPNRIAVCGFVLCLAFTFMPELRLLLSDINEGTADILAWSLLSIEAAAALHLFHHLATLSEDDPDYGNVLPINPWDMKAAEVRRRNRVQLQRMPQFSKTLMQNVYRRLDRITAHQATSRWERVALWRMSADWPANWRTGIPAILMMNIGLIIRADGIATEQQLATSLLLPLTFSLGFGYMSWLPQSQRWSRLGYESLRPVTRRQWIRENATAILLDVVHMQIVCLVVQMCVILWLLPAFWNSVVLLNALVLLLGAHVLLFGIGAWTASLGSMLWKMFCFCGVFGVAQAMWLFMGSVLVSWNWLVPMISICCAVAGSGIMAVAWRRWSRMDLC